MMMRYRLVLLLFVLAVAGAVGHQPALEQWRRYNRPNWRVDKVQRGTIVGVVNATGSVKPVLSVQVGSFVSGPIQDLFVDFNQEVEKGQLLATVDPRTFEAAVAHDRAVLATRQAEVARAEAQLRQAQNDEGRALALEKENADFISDQEMDQLKFNRQAMEATVMLAKAAVEQAEASLRSSETNLGYTQITAPVSGTIIERKIDPGQTVAAQFQTPELFVVAPDMRKKMHIYASVDEADIGLLRAAQAEGQPVHFTVDAYPDDLFEGVIEEIRFSSAETQGVVTYPVIVAASNPDLKLLPGMTASISFVVDQRADVLKIPNAALRFYPDEKHVREEDRKLLEGKSWEKETKEQTDVILSATEKAEARRKRNRRHVWVVDGNFLKAVEVETGLSDSKFTELVSQTLTEGAELVTGIEPKKRFGG